MSHRIVVWLLKCYPLDWRSEYGAEMEDLLLKEPLSLPGICNVLFGALRERARQPAGQFVISSVLVWAGFFVLGLFFSHLLWGLVTAQ